MVFSTWQRWTKNAWNWLEHENWCLRWRRYFFGNKTGEQEHGLHYSWSGAKISYLSIHIKTCWKNYNSIYFFFLSIFYWWNFNPELPKISEIEEKFQYDIRTRYLWINYWEQIQHWNEIKKLKFTWIRIVLQQKRKRKNLNFWTQ